MNKIRIHSDSFEELLLTLREINDDEDLFVEIINEEGEVLVYDNGMFAVASGADHCWFEADQLVDPQREMLEATLVDHLLRIVNNIIAGALNNVE